MSSKDVNINLSTEIHEAVKKLSANIYFDKTILSYRSMLADFLNLSGDERTQSLKKLERNIRSGKFGVRGKVNVLLMPKKVEPKKIECMDANFFTNKTQLSDSVVNRLNIFVDTTIEIHLISVLWTMRYGPVLDKSLDKNCLGNRLDLDINDKIPDGRRLFKQYTPQFQQWWSSALKAAQNLLNDEKDATIVNLDFRDYYHRVELDFNEVESFIIKQTGDKSILQDPLHTIFRKIHTSYRIAFKKLGHQGLRGNASGCSLPIGLLSSAVLANFYLHDFDTDLKKKINPAYYGRYVDDILIVIPNTVLDFENDIDCKDENGVESKEPKLVKYYFQHHLHPVFQFQSVPGGDEYRLVYPTKKYENLLFQKDKLFIYQFDTQLSPDLLKKFEKEQRNRVSAFQFLSEDDDALYVDLDEIVFEDNFRQDELGGGRFKAINDNKYELSVYLAKLIRGSAMTGKDFRPDQAKKVAKYFQGHQLIRSFYFWEKLFQFWFIREDYQKVFDLYAEIVEEVEKLTTRPENEGGLLSDKLKKAKESLLQYLQSTFLMAYGLHPEFNKGKIKLTKKQKDILLEFEGKGTFFRTAGLLRKSCIHFPLAQFVKLENGGDVLFPLYKMPFGNQFELQLDLDRSFPYRVKFYEVALFEHFSRLSQYAGTSFKDNKYQEGDYLDTFEILKESWRKFTSINELASEDLEVLKGYFGTSRDQSSPGDSGIRDLEISMRNGGGCGSGKCRIGVVNRYVDLREDEKSLEGNPIFGDERFQEFNRIWDDIAKIPKCDLFIMPELALPWQLAHYYATISVHRQVGFFTGLEHFKSGDVAFNLTFTCLPISVEGDNDAIPLFRLKNHYSHAEETWIYDKRMIVPRPKPFRYNLFKWRGLYFTEYNCFELANVRHRNLFYGKIDMLFSPIWNRDMHYYNSLVESTSRDMHLPVIMCNTSQYGDSRVTMPYGHVKRDKLRVKGGNVKAGKVKGETINGYRTAILVADIDIKQLRYFQTHNYSAATDFNRDNKSDYKPLPPDYPFEEAKKRHELK